METKNINKIIVSIIVTLASITTAYSEPQEVWHGWMNLTPCSRVEWTNNGLFGTPSSTARTAPQELHGYITIDLPNEKSVIDRVKSCADKGVSAAGLAAVLTNWSGAWPAFNATFQQCLKNAPKNILSKAVNFRSDTSCKW
jgi:hypothetical protein